MDILAQNDAIFENFFEGIGLVNFFADDSFNPIENLFLLFSLAALTYLQENTTIRQYR